MIIGIAPGTAVMLGLAYAGLGLWALFLGTLATVATRWIVQSIAMHTLLPGIHFRIAFPHGAAARGFLSLSALVFLSQLSDVVDSQWDKVVLAHFVGAASVAYFAVATSLLLQLKLVAALPLTPVIAAVAELREKDAAALERTYSLLARLTAALSATLFAAVFVMGPAFFRIWLGPEFTTAGLAVRLFAVAVAINLINAAAAFRCFGLGWHRIPAASALSNILVNGVLSFVLAARIGFVGPFIGSIAGNAAGALVFYALLWRRTRDRWTIPRLLAPTVAAGIAALTILLGLDQPSNWINLIASSALLVLAMAVVTTLVERLPIASLLRRST
jgi:O-antigen/teichoic acid export membrane protein